MAGSFRTTLAKAASRRDFDAATQDELLTIDVAGVLPLVGGQLYLPAPNDCVLDEKGQRVPGATGDDSRRAKGRIGRPPACGRCLIDADDDFKPEPGPAFWPMSRYAEWLTGQTFDPRSDGFLAQPAGGPARPRQPRCRHRGGRGRAAVHHRRHRLAALPRHGRSPGPAKPTGPPRCERFAEIELAARVENVPEWGSKPWRISRLAPPRRRAAAGPLATHDDADGVAVSGRCQDGPGENEPE